MVLPGDIAFKIDGSDDGAAAVNHFSFFINAADIFVGQAESMTIFKQVADRHTGFGINVSVGLSVADELVLVIDNLSVQDIAADNYSVKVHNRGIFNRMSQRHSFVRFQETSFIDTAQNIIVIVHYLSGGRHGTDNIAVIVNDRRGFNRIAHIASVFGNSLSVQQRAPHDRFTVIANVAAGRYHA